ncbi:MAG: hypothetical protein CMF70_01875 [Magnetovibrio sp.]|nr:hypothetical protein [Magnetovibrio sp.]
MFFHVAFFMGKRFIMDNYHKVLSKITAVFVVSAVFVIPMDGLAVTIEDALLKAYINNPQLLAKRASLRGTDESVSQALANWRPNVSASGSVGGAWETSSSSTPTGYEQRYPKTLDISITQSLYRGGRTLASIGEAENNVRAAQARLLDAEQTVLLEAANAYLAVFRDHAVLKLNVNSEQVLERQLQAARDRFEVGEITRTDVNQSEARLAKSKADRIQAEGDLETSRATYLKVVGELAPPNLTLPTIKFNLPEDVLAAVKLAVAKNYSVVAAEFDKKAGQENVKKVWGELLPTVEVSAGTGRDLETSTSINRKTDHTITLDVTIPIYQKGAVFSRLRQARQQVAENVYNIDLQRRNASEAATQAWESLIAARARVEAFQRQVDANKIALDGVQQEASVGSRTVLDVLDAEQELQDSRVSHVKAQTEQFVAMFKLKSAIGELTASKLGFAVDVYDFRAHYNEIRGKLFGGHSTGEVQ